MLKERTGTINKKIKLHILGMPVNKLGNWLIFCNLHFAFTRAICHG